MSDKPERKRIVSGKVDFVNAPATSSLSIMSSQAPPAPSRTPNVSANANAVSLGFFQKTQSCEKQKNPNVKQDSWSRTDERLPTRERRSRRRRGNDGDGNVGDGDGGDGDGGDVDITNLIDITNFPLTGNNLSLPQPQPQPKVEVDPVSVLTSTSKLKMPKAKLKGDLTIENISLPEMSKLQRLRVNSAQIREVNFPDKLRAKTIEIDSGDVKKIKIPKKLQAENLQIDSAKVKRVAMPRKATLSELKIPRATVSQLTMPRTAKLSKLEVNQVDVPEFEVPRMRVKTLEVERVQLPPETQTPMPMAPMPQIPPSTAPSNVNPVQIVHHVIDSSHQRQRIRRRRSKTSEIQQPRNPRELTEMAIREFIPAHPPILMPPTYGTVTYIQQEPGQFQNILTYDPNYQNNLVDHDQMNILFNSTPPSYTTETPYTTAYVTATPPAFATAPAYTSRPLSPETLNLGAIGNQFTGLGHTISLIIESVTSLLSDLFRLDSSATLGDVNSLLLSNNRLYYVGVLVVSLYFIRKLLV